MDYKKERLLGGPKNVPLLPTFIGFNLKVYETKKKYAFDEGRWNGKLMKLFKKRKSTYSRKRSASVEVNKFTVEQSLLNMGIVHVLCILSAFKTQLKNKKCSKHHMEY